MTAQKEHVILNVATMARTENRTVNNYQQRGILPPVGDHHQANASMVGAAVYMNMIVTIRMIMMSQCPAKLCRSILTAASPTTGCARKILEASRFLRDTERREASRQEPYALL
jgi:hypothetical protein